MNLNTTIPTTSSEASISFGSTPKTGVITFGIGNLTPVSNIASAPNAGQMFSSGSLTSTAPSITPLGSGTNTTTSTGLTFATKTPSLHFSVPTVGTTVTSDANKISTPNTQATLTTTTSTTSSVAATNAGQLNCCQLEEYNNKWLVKLEDQEKMFINLATEVNSWDKILNINNNKIIELSEAVEKVKIEQQALEQELEVIAAHHTELDEIITPLQKELSKLPHADIEKAQTYVLAESLDTQLRQMSKDLKEVIEHLNEMNKVQNANDPIVQIGQILNAHVSSMHWIESSVSQVSSKIDEISKMYDSISRDNERSLRLAYNN